MQGTMDQTDSWFSTVMEAGRLQTDLKLMKVCKGKKNVPVYVWGAGVQLA